MEIADQTVSCHKTLMLRFSVQLITMTDVVFVVSAPVMGSTTLSTQTPGCLQMTRPIHVFPPTLKLCTYLTTNSGKSCGENSWLDNRSVNEPIV